ncbi:Acetophenone carboxylase gamma subunit [Polystyrenella longa]|uniref:Acetophenone carboxylase gamma subunit n=1 Tax=Polystyrenella longa TaxID=2528007 RepID=A0A518CM77_9PLAN|nr:hydantoinase B/oxoprolinase family protein [Polystyrenella longa]QDU80340.1 Acetophenone carboxylase gamma subunit [Polystyrenella longa]
MKPVPNAAGTGREMLEFWIDVGGTFTDVLMREPKGRIHTFKTLSSGITRGSIFTQIDSQQFVDPLRQNDPSQFWIGYEIKLFDESGTLLKSSTVTGYDSSTGQISLADSILESAVTGLTYELTAGEESPVLSIRYLLGLKLDEKIPPVIVKLGTTRGTNALLTRSGARTAFITTEGFRDILLIGNQDRPRLFDLKIEKPEPLFESVVEVKERMTVEGEVLISPNLEAIRRELESLKSTGIESIAICLLHAFANSEHEEMVESVAREIGFRNITRSSQLSPLIKIISRGDTTVVDAYLNPVLQNYVSRLRSRLGDSRIQLMTSAGGLVDADHFSGKDSILSGPAGGVVGFSEVGKQAGFAKSIGFDMGGTSTDVSRFDGVFEREFETRKAGVRIVAPMLAIETVAAGGGSICDFDGVKLHVGPASAGADPGPACYGAGGPLTVTDVNLYLGKILPQYFPFQLNQEIVGIKLQEICDRITASPLGKNYTPEELAEGFQQIANANMVRAIRNISVAKGYDPAEYALISFGGAGGQHACAMARSLGMRDIVIHPYAGILSAYGIGLSDVRQFAERSLLSLYDNDFESTLDSLFAELEHEATAQVLAEGVREEQLQSPIRSLELRYCGVDSTIVVTCSEGDGDYKKQYGQLHQQRYGYQHRERDVEVVTARVEVIGRMPRPEWPVQLESTGELTSSERTPVLFAGKWETTSIYHRRELKPGNQIAGPAIVCEPTSTVLIDPGFSARIGQQGELLIKDVSQTTQFQLSAKEVDPVQLEIFNNLFASIAEQMGVTLQKTSCSTNVKERLDFSCAIFTPAGDLVVNAPHIPVHLGAMGETVRHILKDNPEIEPGDVFVTNDPYRGGSHLPDVTVVTPVHDEHSDELLFLTASRAHHAEIGGIVPGSMPPFSTNLAEEGVVIRNFKLVDRGASREAELRALLLSGPHPSRSVEDNLSDVSAQVAANQSGAIQLLDLVERYTQPVVQAYMRFIQEAAAAKMRMALRELPDGIYERTDHQDDGSPVRVKITKQGESAHVDFTGTGPVLQTNLNANRAIVTAAVLYVFRCMIDEDIPLNSGVLEPITINLPECLLSPPEQDRPEDCAAIVGGNVETSQKVVDILLGALGLAAASQGTMNNLTFGDDSFGYYETICGGSGATSDAAGTDAVHTHMTNTRMTDPEVFERRYPVRLWEFSVRTGSGGAGRFPGGDGITRRIEFLRSLKVSMLSERRGEYLPFGLEGGSPGAKGINTLLKASEQKTGEENQTDLGGKFAIEVEPGDQLLIETPGGGGYFFAEDG